MRAILKGAEPRELLNWKALNRATPQNLRYGRADFPAEAVRRSLLREQFHLCAYTMRHLETAKGGDTGSACHVEHIRPQSRQVPGEDIDYQNMLACYPPNRSGVACGFGATAKADFDPTTGLFVSPLSQQPEIHFEFARHGCVTGLTPAGRATIDVLNLNHPALVNDRAAVIKGKLKPRGKPLTVKAARRLADQVMVPDAQGCLVPYCVAVASAARAFAEREERRAARLRRNDST